MKLLYCSPFKSVDTPVAYNPLDATAKDPPKSTEKGVSRDTDGRTMSDYPCSQLFLRE
jgi:hypothetical protein